MKHLKQVFIPRKLYKYYTINDYFFKFIEESSCWFSKPEDFNDPFDCHININIGNNKEEILLNMEQCNFMPILRTDYSEEFVDIANKTVNNTSLFNEFLTFAHQMAINKTIGVYCLTENSNNILMWAHYADSHKGVCVEFEIEENGFFYKNLLPVQYEKKYPIFELSQYRNEKNMFFSMHQQVVCAKSTLWKYEKEWRVVVEDGYGLYPINKEQVTKIIFGVNTPDKDKEEVISAIKLNNYTKTKFFNCELSDNTYALKIKKLQTHTT